MSVLVLVVSALLCHSSAGVPRPKSLKLTYFGVPGRGHPIRSALFLGDIEYEEEIMEWDPFVEMRNRGELEWFGLPELTMVMSDDKVIKVGQTIAILKFIGRLTGLYPEDPIQSLFVDELLNAVEDMNDVVSPSIYETDLVKRTEMRKQLCEDTSHKGLAYWLAKFERKLKKNQEVYSGSLYFVGSAMTVADLRLYFFFNKLYKNEVDGIDATMFEGFPLIRKFCDNVNGNEKIAAFKRQYKEKYEAKAEL